MIERHRTLYKRTSAGKIQIWYMQRTGDKFRTISGQKDGKLVTSEWTVAEPKNVGRANATTGEEQALLEVTALYKKKLEQNGYFEELTDVDEDRGFFEPMLAKPFDADRLPDGEKFFIQPKFNGVRCIAKKDGLWSRKGKRFVNCPHIEEELKSFFDKHPEAILDAELYNHSYNSDFEKLISSIKKQKPTPDTIAKAAKVVQLYIYDYPSHSGNFEPRWETLELTFAEELPENEIIRLSTTWATRDVKTVQGLHKKNLAAGYEGTMVRLNRPYENKRTFSLMKYKDFKDEEFEIVNIQVGKGNWSDAAKIVTLKMPDGREFGAGVKGSKEYAKKLLDDRYTLIGKLGTVVFFDFTADGIPLFPIFHGVRDYE